MSQQTKWVPSSVDLEKPSAARVYDYVLGGNHNFQVDRDFVDEALRRQPEIKRFAIMNRSFLRRAILFLAERGIRQFLDLGSGIPTVGNVHEVAQQIDPATKVVYVDNEHVAVAHSQLLLEDDDNATMVHADITRPRLVLHDPETRRLLDFDQPVGLLAITIGHYIRDEHDPAGVFASYREALAPGSYLALTHFTTDLDEDRDVVVEMMKRSQNAVTPRTREQVTEFFGDFEMVEPGLVMTSHWRPERREEIADVNDGLWAGVARKK